MCAPLTVSFSTKQVLQQIVAEPVWHLLRSAQRMLFSSRVLSAFEPLQASPEMLSLGIFPL